MTAVHPGSRWENIEANKLLMLARSEAEQIQQIQRKIPTAISETDRHCIISPCRSI